MSVVNFKPSIVGVGLFLASGCAVLTARIDVYDDTKKSCVLDADAKRQIAEERKLAAKAQHSMIEYEPGSKAKEDRDAALKESDPEVAVALLEATNLRASRDQVLTSLLDDKAVGPVVHADRKCWKPAKPANKARGVSRGGNADIAIKMEKDGKFVVKGVRLDAEKVTEAVFKSVTKAIVLVAKAYGVPIDGVGTPAKGDGVSAEGMLLDVESKLRIEKRAAVEMLDVLMNEEAAAAGSAAEKAAAAVRLKASLASRRDIFETLYKPASGTK